MQVWCISRKVADPPPKDWMPIIPKVKKIRHNPVGLGCGAFCICFTEGLLSLDIALIIPAEGAFHLWYNYRVIPLKEIRMVDPKLLEILRCPACVREKPGLLTLVKESWLVCSD